MHHRAVQNTVPLDARHMNLGKALRNAGYDPALIGYTTTTPDPRTTGPRDPRFTTLGDLMDGFRSVGAFEPNMEGYFGWLAHQGYTLPARRADVWLPEGEDAVPGATDFAWAFGVAGLLVLASAPFMARLPPEAGAEVSGHGSTAGKV
jgi:arylsulfatase A-like enzyme